LSSNCTILGVPSGRRFFLRGPPIQRSITITRDTGGF
jgi:hypothetical protein